MLYFIWILGNISSASIKSLWVVRREVQSPEPRHCQAKIASADLIISYITFDRHDIFSSDVIDLISSENLVPSRMDVGDGLPG